MRNFLASPFFRIVLIIVGYVLIWGLLFLAMGIDFFPMAAVVLLVCAFFGWKALNRITPNIFLFMSFAGWIVYFLIKGILSVIIGAFVAPFKIAQMIVNKVGESISK